MPNLLTQSRGLLAFMAAGVADARPFDDIWVAHADDKVAAAAVWLPPGTYPRGVRRELITNLRGLPAFARAGRHTAASFRILDAAASAVCA